MRIEGKRQTDPVRWFARLSNRLPYSHGSTADEALEAARERWEASQEPGAGTEAERSQKGTSR